MTGDDRIQTMIDRALDDLASAAPAPDFVPRLRAHIERTRKTPLRTWQPVAAVGIVAIVAIGIGVARSTRAPMDVRYAAPVTAAAPEARVSSLPPASRAPSRQHGKVLRRRLPLETTILVPDQREALGRFVSTLQLGEPDALRILRNVPAAGVPIVIEPIRIDPVVVPPLPEGGDR